MGRQDKARRATPLISAARSSAFFWRPTDVLISDCG
jgi:hypothetical protein